MDVGTVGTLLQVTFLQAQIDGKKADAVAVDGTDILFACNDADKAAAQQAVKEYAACAGPLLARAVKDCLTADQLTVNVRLRACYTTVSLDEIVKKTIMAAIVKERLVNTDPSVVAPVDWQAHGLIMDKAKDVLVIKMTTGSVFDQPTPKPTRGVAATSTKLIVVRSTPAPAITVFTCCNLLQLCGCQSWIWALCRMGHRSNSCVGKARQDATRPGE